jgi:hypothetical protein
MSDTITGLGRAVSSSVGATAQVLFAAGTESIDAILLTNHHATKTLHCRLSSDFSSAPTISSTAHHIPVPPNSMVEIRVGKGLAVWVKSEDSTTINYTAQEVKS